MHPPVAINKRRKTLAQNPKRFRPGFLPDAKSYTLTQAAILSALGLSLAGNAGKALRVKADETGLEFVTDTAP